MKKGASEMRARNFFAPLITITVSAILIMVTNAHAYPLADKAAPPQDPATSSAAIHRYFNIRDA
jgi:hypothetical protein